MQCSRQEIDMFSSSARSCSPRRWTCARANKKQSKPSDESQTASSTSQQGSIRNRGRPREPEKSTCVVDETLDLCVKASGTDKIWTLFKWCVLGANYGGSAFLWAPFAIFKADLLSFERIRLFFNRVEPLGEQQLHTKKTHHKAALTKNTHR